MRKDVRKFLKYIEDAGGIYKHRWGDHIIQTLALKLFARRDEVQRVPGILLGEE